MPLKFCANLSFLFQENSSLLERYGLAKKAGFKAVECGFPYEYPVEEIVKAKTEAGLEQVLINSYPGNWSRGERGLATYAGRKREFEESVRQAAEYAVKLDCKRVHIMAGLLDSRSLDSLTIYTYNLKFAADYLKKHDIMCLIEPINPNTVPHYFLNSFQKAMTMVENIGCDNIKLLLDIFHLQQICGNLTKNIEKFLPRVGHIQIAQVPDRNEPNIPGEIDYKYIFSLLEKLNYSGWIGLEYKPKTGTTEGLRWIEEFGYSL